MTYRGWAKAVEHKYPAQSTTATAMNLHSSRWSKSGHLRTKEGFISNAHCKMHLTRHIQNTEHINPKWRPKEQ